MKHCEKSERFFHRYDAFYFAHQIPCMINYFLCISVSETMRGVSYIEEYLRRLFVENLFIRLFPIDAVDRLLTSVYLNYHESPLNLYSPVLIGAVTLKILGEDPKTLKVTKDRKNKLFKAFEGISPNREKRSFLKWQAVYCENACRLIGMNMIILKKPLLSYIRVLFECLDEV